MFSKTVGIVVVVLAVALVAGMGYIVLRPENAEAHGGGQDRTTRVADRTLEHSGGSGNGQSGAEAARSGGGRGQGSASETLARNANTPIEHDAGEMETVRGIVLVSDSEILVQTAAGSEVLVGLGQAWYREQAGFVVAVGDEVVVVGFHEDGEFKAATVENVTTGATITLRDATGRPAWAGQGNRRNSQP